MKTYFFVIFASLFPDWCERHKGTFMEVTSELLSAKRDGIF